MSARSETGPPDPDETRTAATGMAAGAKNQRSLENANNTHNPAAAQDRSDHDPYDDLPDDDLPDELMSDQTPVEVIERRRSNNMDDSIPLIIATPFSGRDPGLIPRRQTIYPGYVPKQLSVTVGEMGIGKSGLLHAEAIAIITGIPLLGITPNIISRVWIVNLDDPLEELEKTNAGILQYYGIPAEKVMGQLFLDSGRDHDFKLVKASSGGVRVNDELLADMISTIRRNNIGVLILDPLIGLHSVEENSNSAMEIVARALTTIAEKSGAAVSVAHHPRKSQGDRISAADSRGGSSLGGVARLVNVVNRMPEAEARKAGLIDPREVFSVEVDKSNFTKTGGKRWYRLRSVTLPNGDDVRVVEAWEVPSATDAVNDDLTEKARELARAGKYREDSRSPDWFGIPLASILGLDPKNKHDVRRLTSLMKEWRTRGVIAIEDRQDQNRKTRQFIIQGASDGLRQSQE